MSIFSSSINKSYGIDPRSIIPFANYVGESSGITKDKHALRLSAFFGGIHMISSNIASLDSQVIQELPNGNRDNKPAHQLHDVLKYQPNPYTTAYKFHKFMVVSLMLNGNAYARIERDGRGDVIAIHQVEPWNVTCVPGGNNGRLYRISGESERFEPMDIIHLFDFTLDGIEGCSYLEAGARQQFGSHLSVQEFNQRFFENNSFLGGILKTDDSLGSDPKVVDQAKSEIRQEWENRFSGASNAGSVPILEGNWDFQEISMSMRDAQLIERSEFTVKEIARILKIPLSMMGIEDANSYNSAESDSKTYIRNCIQPITKIISEEYRSKLIGPAEKRAGYAIQIDPSQLDLITFKDKAEGLKQMILAGILDINEARRRFNLDTKEGLDIHTIQKNMDIVFQDGQVQELSSENGESVNVS